MLKQIKNVIKVFKPLLKKISHDNIFAIAGQSAFFLILSAVPLTMFAVSVMQNMHFPVETLENLFKLVFNEEVTGYFSNYLSNVYQDATSISIITLVITLWSAAQGIHAVTNGLNRVYGTYENRNWLFLRLRAMIYTVVIFAILFSSMIVVVFGSFLNEQLSPYLLYLPDMVAVMFHLRYLIIFVYIVFLFSLLYRNFPNLSKDMRKEFGISRQLPGAVFSAVAWFVLSFGISIYVADFNGFSIYGGLTRLAVIMIWLYFCMVCLMIGAEINYVYHDKIKTVTSYMGKRRKKNRRK